MDSRLPCGGSLQRSTSLTNRAGVVSTHSLRTGRTIPSLDVNGMSHKPALRVARQPAEPPRIIRGIRLSRFPLVVIADPELNGEASRKRSPEPGPRPLQVAKRSRLRGPCDIDLSHVPRSTDLELMSVGPMTQNAHAQSLLLLASWTLGISDSALQTAPTLTWEQGTQSILDLRKSEDELDGMVAVFINAAFSHTSLGARLASALAWAMPRYSRFGQMKLARVRQASAAAGRCSGNDDNGLEGNEQRTRRGSCTVELGAHAYLRPRKLARMWVTSDGNVSSDRAAVVLHPVEESKASKTGEYDETVIKDNAALVRALFQATRTAPSPKPPLWRARSLLANFSSGKLRCLEPKRLFGKQVPHVLRHTGASANGWAQRRSLTEIQAKADGKPRDQCDAASKVVVSPTR